MIFYMFWIGIGGVLVWILLGVAYGRKLPAKHPRWLRIGSANLLYSNQQTPVAISRKLLEWDLDVLVCLEWTGRNLELNSWMEAGYEMLLNHPQEGPNGICVFMHRTEYSRWKCIEAAIVEATGKPPLITPIASVRFAGVQTSLTLLGMHPPAPTPENAGMNQPCLIKSAAWCADGRLQVPVGTGQKNDLVVMAGDFNAFPFDSGILAIRQAGLNDTYATTNRRPGPTWSFWPRIFRWARIDYIFVSSEVGVRKAVPCAIPGSDHHAVIADLLRPD